MTHDHGTLGAYWFPGEVHLHGERPPHGLGQALRSPRACHDAKEHLQASDSGRNKRRRSRRRRRDDDDDDDDDDRAGG